MSGAGYNDPDKLAAARELAMSFGNSSQPKGGGGGGGGGRQRNGNNFESRAPRERYNYSPPPPPRAVISNIPPPSRRNYTNTLVPGPPKHPPGQILGASSMDFLNRRESTPQPTPANPPQAPPNQNTMAAIPPSITNNPVKKVVQEQNGTGVSGNENHTIAPARANEGRMVDIKAESAKALSTEVGKPKTGLPMNAAPAQTPALAPGNLPNNNNIASTWAASYNDSSDEEEEEGEIIERPKAEPSKKEDMPILPKVEEVDDLITISPDHKYNSLYRGGISAPPMVPTDTTNGISVQKVRNNIVPPVQVNGCGPAQGSSAIEQASHELTTSQDQTRDENKPGELNNISILRPQAPGFVPGSRAVSLESPMSPPGFPPSAPTANPSAAKLDTESLEAAPSHQSHAQYPAAENVDGSPSFAGHIITITPVQITNGLIVPGPANGHVFMQPHVNTPQHHQAVPMQFPAMPIAPGPTQPSQASGNMTAPVEKPKPKTQGLKSSMWAR